MEHVHQSVKIHNLPESLRGLWIGLLSDFHSSFIVSQKLLAGAAEMILAENPDLIVLTGDYISGPMRFMSIQVVSS